MNTATREIPPLVSGPVGLSRYSYATPIMMARAATGADIIAGSDFEPPQGARRTPTQVEKARKLVRECLKKRYKDC